MAGVFGLALVSAGTAFGQTNNFTFTNKYNETINAVVLRVEKDGILYLLACGGGGGKVYFTNLSAEYNSDSATRRIAPTMQPRFKSLPE